MIANLNTNPVVNSVVLFIKQNSKSQVKQAADFKNSLIFVRYKTHNYVIFRFI